MTAPFTPMEAWTQYKYVLELDGGSSTWRFKNALLGGFVVLKVDSDDQQCARMRGVYATQDALKRP